MIGINETFPDFKLFGVDGDKIIEISSKNYKGWKVVYFYPKDFTFICPTEITSMDKLNSEADVFGISGDNEY